MEILTNSRTLFSRKHHWQTVNLSLYQKIRFHHFLIDRIIPEKGTLKLMITTNACKNTINEVNYLEHVQAFITLKSTRRGNTVMFLTSPLGTR